MKQTIWICLPMQVKGPTKLILVLYCPHNDEIRGTVGISCQCKNWPDQEVGWGGKDDCRSNTQMLISFIMLSKVFLALLLNAGYWSGWVKGQIVIAKNPKQGLHWCAEDLHRSQNRYLRGVGDWFLYWWILLKSKDLEDQLKTYTHSFAYRSCAFISAWQQLLQLRLIA